jgi:hypothetical protein
LNKGVGTLGNSNISNFSFFKNIQYNSNQLVGKNQILTFEKKQVRDDSDMKMIFINKIDLVKGGHKLAQPHSVSKFKPLPSKKYK